MVFCRSGIEIGYEDEDGCCGDEAEELPGEAEKADFDEWSQTSLLTFQGDVVRAFAEPGDE